MVVSFAVFAKLAGALVLLPAAFLAGCSESGSTPSAPSTPPPPTYTLTAWVYYDENADTVVDLNREFVRIPQVRLVAGSSAAVSAAGGRTTLERLSGGPQTLTVDVGSLPPGFLPGAAVPINLPATPEVAVPVVLPIGDNRPNVYMAFGDSITVGIDGSNDRAGYRRKLERKLNAYWGGDQDVADRGVQGSKTPAGLSRIRSSLNRERPAYTLIHYGTNDWNDGTCRTRDSCTTVDNLRGMISAARERQTIPVIATIIPVNVNYDARVPQGRQDWVAYVGGLIRSMAAAENVLLADMEKAFLATPNLSGLFADHVHPNDAGYEIMAAVWFKTITTPRSAAAAPTDAWAAASSAPAKALWSPPGRASAGGR